MRLDIQKIIGALSHARVIECFECGDGSSDGIAPGEARALALGDEFVRSFIQRRIVQKLKMSGDNLLPLCPAGTANASQPEPYVCAGSVKFLPLVGRARSLLGNFDLAALDSCSPADRKARHRAYAAELAVPGYTLGDARCADGSARRLDQHRPMQRFQLLSLLQTFDHGVYGLCSFMALGAQGQLVAVADAQGHDGDHTTSVGGAAVSGKGDLCAKGFSAPREQRCRPRMQPLAQ
jgi:hypothetical protein